MPQGRMMAVGIISSLDELQHRQASFLSRAEPVQELAIQDGKVALAESVVVGVSHQAHRRAHGGLPAALAEGQPCVMAALGRVIDHTLRTSLVDGHFESVQGQIGPQTSCHRPVDHAAAPGIDDHYKIYSSWPPGQEPGADRDIGDMSHPKPVRAGCGEIMLHRVRGRLFSRLAHGHARTLAPAHSMQAACSHQPRHLLAAHSRAINDQFDVNARLAIGASSMQVDPPDAFSQDFASKVKLLILAA